jgi:hypothetical protein
MKKFQFATTALLFLLTITSYSQNTTVYDLQKLMKNNGIDIFNREVTPINDGTHSGIHMSRDEGEGVVWLKDVEFSNGTLEFDVRGEDVMNHSFVGIAFHGKDNATFDAIYLRPFRFKDTNEELKSHQIQYISLPNFPWRTLREKYPNKYEHSVIAPIPDPNSWIRMKVVVNGSTVSAYLNGSKEPSMVCEKVTSQNTGSIGFYVADTSGGDFANISVTKTK